MNFTTKVFLLAGGLLTAAPVVSAKNGDVRVADGAYAVSAPGNISCSAPPDFTLTGPASGLFGGERKRISALVALMAKGIAQGCPKVEELTVRGSDRGVSYSFTVSRENGWLLDGPGKPLPVPAPAAKPAPATNAAVSEPAPKPEKPKPAAGAPAKQAAAPAPGIGVDRFAAGFGGLRSIRGYAALDSEEIWQRILAARAYAAIPSILEDDQMALGVAGMMLTPVEYQQFIGVYGNKRPDQLSVFERRDLANRVRTQLKPGLDARRVAGPMKVYHVAQIQLGEYSFDQGAFPLNAERLRQHPSPSWHSSRIANAFNSVVLPTELQANADQARQLDAYLRNRQNNRLFLAVFAEIDPETPRSLKHHNYQLTTRTKLHQIALFADEGLTQIIVDFTPVLAERQKSADLVAALIQKPLSFGEDLLRAINQLTDSTAGVDALAHAYSVGREDAAKRQSAVRAAFAEPMGPVMLEMMGTIRFGPYDPVRKVLPVQRFTTRLREFAQFPVGLAVNASFLPPLNEVQVSPEAAQKLQAVGQSGQQLEMRLEAEVMNGNIHSPQHDYLQVDASFRPHRLIVFTGRNSAAPAQRELLIDTVLPETDGLETVFEGLRLDQ